MSLRCSPGPLLSPGPGMGPLGAGGDRHADPHWDQPSPQEEEDSEHALTEEEITAAADAWARGAAALPKPWKPQKPV